MRRTTITVFEVLERAWATRDCALIDMKIEFGVDTNGEIIVSDIIDSDSWRLWPSGDKRLMKDKQVYRNLATVTDADLSTVKRNFEWVADQLDYLVPPPSALVVILMGSPSDKEHCEKIAKHATALGLKAQLRVSSAHKATEETLRILAEYEGSGEKVRTRPTRSLRRGEKSHCRLVFSADFYPTRLILFRKCYTTTALRRFFK